MLAKDFWQGALCAEIDPELFFPLKGKFLDAQNAKQICNRCELKQKCLEYALKDPELKGIWGGTNEPDRYKMRNRSGKWN
jgi:WhiB family transcriptional regulator, redox-sensing transcriptional regulator